MENLKNYKSFILNEGILDKILGSDSQISEVSTESLMDAISKKIKENNDSPMYVFNQIGTSDEFYVSAEFFNEAKNFGFEQEKQGTLYTPAGRYSYSILDCSLMQSFDIEKIKSDLSGILRKNSGSGIKTIVEFSNISSIKKDQISSIGEIVSSRTILDYSIKTGDFFILSDNSNNQRGGSDLSGTISSFLPKIEVEKFKHNFSQEAENLA